MKSFCFLFLLLVSTQGYAVTLKHILIEPITIGTFTPAPFVPVIKKTQYALEIDAGKSYFSIEKNPVSYDRADLRTVFNFPDAPESFKYQISGNINISDIYEETADYLLDQVTITSIDIDTHFNNINLLSIDGFWDESYNIEYLFVDKTPNICACSTTVIGDSMWYMKPYIEAEFDGMKLGYTGEGLFKKDENGMFLLESSFDATHKISYHIEANVVSAVPVPAAFYLFFSGLSGLLITRFRKIV